MKYIGIFAFEVFGRFLSILPKRGIYVFADFLYLVGYYVIGYRKKVVFQNLQNSFPEKTAGEIEKIARKFFHHLSDVMIENIAFLYIRPERIKQFVSVKNIELLHKHYQDNKNITGIIGHYGNWELLTTLPLHTSYTIMSVYKPLKNKFFDRKVYQMRQRLNCIPIPMKKVFKAVWEHEKKNQPYITGLVSDQSPPKRDINYWTTFLNQETAVFSGPEKIAKKFNHAVLFTVVHKIKRGSYQIEFIQLTEEAAKTKEHEITELYIQTLERIIREKPEYWLWSHRRWKHKKT